MADDDLRDPSPRGKTAFPQALSPALQPLYQTLLMTVVNMDLEYEGARAELSRGPADEPGRQRALARLRDRHHARRAPYLQHLAILQIRIQQGWH